MPQLVCFIFLTSNVFITSLALPHHEVFMLETNLFAHEISHCRPLGIKVCQRTESEFEEQENEFMKQDKKCRPLPPSARVRMNFKEAEVIEIVQWISKQTCKNFILSDKLRGGKITVLSNTPVSPYEAYRAFLAALNVNNMTVVQVGEFYKVQMKRDASRDTIPTYLGDQAKIPYLDMMVTHLIQLQYVDAKTVNATIKQLLSRDGETLSYMPTNSLIVSDTASNMNRIKKILKQLDTPMGQEEIRVIRVKFALATELADMLKEIFIETTSRVKTTQAQGRVAIRQVPSQAKEALGTEEEGVNISKILADERTNQLIIVATARSFTRLQELIDKLDVPIPGEGQIQVVYLENADAEELADTLTTLTQGSASAGRTSRARTSRQQVSALFQEEVKVTADAATNSLVIIATQNDFRSLVQVIKKLDLPRRQVFIEAVIMEVSLTSKKDTGVSFHGIVNIDVGDETIPLIFGGMQADDLSSLNLFQSNMLGLLAGALGPSSDLDDVINTGDLDFDLPSFGVVLHMLQVYANTNLISMPHILTSDNKEAEISVTDDVPYPSGFTPTTGLGSLATSTRQQGLGDLLGSLTYNINREPVGMILKITPQINEGDYIRLEIEEELSEIKGVQGEYGPTFTQRTSKTVVVAKNQQTVVIGGLMRDKIDESESKIPFLGDIPVIGWFFRHKSKTKEKTNLLLFLTPYIIENQADFQAIFERKIQERNEFLAYFNENVDNYEPYIDFTHKRGPLASIHVTFRKEMAKLENKGPGIEGEILISPTGSDELDYEQLGTE